MEKINRKKIQIATYPNIILRQRCKEIIQDDFGSKELSILCDIMEKMLKKHDGIGLAAPQIGLNYRIVLIAPNKKEKFFLINPVIKETGGRQVMDQEGCLSLPGIFGNVIRPEEVSVEAYDKDGNKFIIKNNELISRIIQHEIDHLDGVLFIDKVVNIVDGADKLEELRKIANKEEI